MVEEVAKTGCAASAALPVSASRLIPRLAFEQIGEREDLMKEHALESTLDAGDPFARDSEPLAQLGLRERGAQTPPPHPAAERHIAMLQMTFASAAGF